MRWRFTLNPDSDNKEISEPIGWAEIIFTFNRNKEWHGVFVEYSLPLRFYDDPQNALKDAYTFIKTEYESVGVEGQVILKVEWACNDTDDFTEEGQWRLNFTSYSEEKSELCTVELNLEPDNLLMTFKNRYDQKVDISSLETFDGSSMVAYDMIDVGMTLPPKAVPAFGDLEIEGGGAFGNVDFTQTDTVVGALGGTSFHNAIAYIQLAFNVINLDEIATRIDIESIAHDTFGDLQPTWRIVIPGDYILTLTDFTFTVNAEATTELDNTSCGSPNLYNDLSVELHVVIGGSDILVDSGSLAAGGCYSSGDTISINADGYVSPEIALALDDEISIYIRIEASGTWDKDLTSKDIEWAINYNQTSRNVVLSAKEFYTATGGVLVNAINETGSRILEAITDLGYKLLSSYYGRTDSEPFESPDGSDGCGSLRVLTTGLHIRKYINAELNMSFKDWFDGLNAIDNIGLGLSSVVIQAQVTQEVIRVEPMEFWYGETAILQLDKIPLVVINVVADEHLSIFRIGYSKWEAEEYTGLDEFATKREYRTTLSSVKNTKDQISQFIASGYAIEFTRRNDYDPLTQDDWRFDNDTFIICCERNEVDDFIVEQGNITSAANLIDPDSIYNFRISPLRNLMRWAKTVLNSYRDVFDANSTLQFTSGDGNYIAAGLMTGGCLIENAAFGENNQVSQSELSDTADALPVYVPEVWEFEFPLSLSQYQIIKANPTELIQCRFNQDTTFRDFYIRNIEFRPNDGLARFQLLPRRLYPIDECSIYIIQTRGIGTGTFGSTPLAGASLSNLFVFVNGELMKYNDANSANNEITSWDTATGYGQLNFSVDYGAQITIIHMPINTSENGCNTCIDRFEGRGNGTDTVVMTGFGIEQIDRLFVFYNGELMKYNDTNPANNELTSYTAVVTKELEFVGHTNANRELRVFGIAGSCPCIRVFSGNGDGTDSPELTGIGDATLANLFVFVNGNLQKYNDSNTSNNEITNYNSGTEVATLNAPVNPAREIRAIKLENC